jgi:hypothetical protein
MQIRNMFVMIVVVVVVVLVVVLNEASSKLDNVCKLIGNIFMVTYLYVLIIL